MLKINNSSLVVRRGATMVDILVAVAVLAVIATALAQTITLALSQMMDARSRLTAINLANEQMEMLRNLPYDRVAVEGGVPSGTIDPDRTVTLRSRVYRILTDVRYVDDPLDGTIDSDVPDVIPTDYKQATVVVTWGDASPARRVQLQSLFVPPGVETAAGGGTLVINIFDGLGVPLSSARVTVHNTTVSPAVLFSAFTDVAGRIIVPGAPAADNYVITVEKSGHESVTTLPPPPGSPFTPTDQHATVLEGELTAQSIVSARLATARFEVRDAFDTPQDGVALHVSGGRVLGTYTDGSFAYSVDEDVVSDDSGDVVRSDTAPGTYTIQVTDSAYTLFEVEDDSTDASTDCAIPPGHNTSCIVRVVNQSQPAVIVHVRDANTGAPIADAVVRLQSTTRDETQSSNRYGDALIAGTRDLPLTTGLYTLTVTADGYTSQQKVLDVTALMSQEFSLTKNP